MWLNSQPHKVYGCNLKGYLFLLFHSEAKKRKVSFLSPMLQGFVLIHSIQRGSLLGFHLLVEISDPLHLVLTLILCASGGQPLKQKLQVMRFQLKPPDESHLGAHSTPMVLRSILFQYWFVCACVGGWVWVGGCGPSSAFEWISIIIFISIYCFNKKICSGYLIHHASAKWKPPSIFLENLGQE